MRAKFVLSDDELQAIGLVAVESTYLEGLIEELIWGLAGLEENTGKFFTDNLRLKARIELLSDIAKPRIKEAGRAKEIHIPDIRSENRY